MTALAQPQSKARARDKACACDTARRVIRRADRGGAMAPSRDLARLQREEGQGVEFRALALFARAWLGAFGS